jgi:tRNA (guanine-N7-)-methyltransferase
MRPSPGVSWSDVFGNDLPVEVEIGPGRGEALLAAAADAPSRNFFAIELRRSAATMLAGRIARRGLANVRVIAADARGVISRLVPDRSVAAYHLLFPDPWPKRRHGRRRLMTPELARHVRRTLADGGAVHLATDLPALLEAYVTMLEAVGLVRVAQAQPPRGRPITKFERKYGRSGTHYARLTRP